MSINSILSVLLVLLVLLFFSCMIVGDAFISKIAFNTSAMDCDSFADITTIPATIPATTTMTTIPATIPATTTMTTIPATTTMTTIPATIPVQKLVRNSTCADLDATQIGFARFRMAMYWIIFILLTFLGIYGGIALASYGWLGIFFVFIGFIVWLFALVGGIFLSKFVFQASTKNCNNSSYYCYELNNAEIIFARMASVFCFMTTFVITGLIIMALYKSV